MNISSIKIFDEREFPYQVTIPVSQDVPINFLRQWGKTTFGSIGKDWDIIVTVDNIDTRWVLHGAFKSEKDSTYFALRWAGTNQ